MYKHLRADAGTVQWRIFSFWRERDPLGYDSLHIVRDGVQSKRVHSNS